MHNVSDVRQIAVYTAEPLYLVPIVLRLKLLLQSWRSINCQVVIKFLQNWLKQEAKYCCLRSINSLTVIGIRKNCLMSGRSLLLPIHRKGDQIYCNNYRGISLLLTSYKILSNIHLSRLSPYVDEIIGIVSVCFNVTDYLLIRFSAFVRYRRKNGSTVRQYISYS
jgi:hypothetical protein